MPAADVTALLEAATEALLLVDADGRVVAASAAAARLLGRAPAGEPLAALAPGLTLAGLLGAPGGLEVEVGGVRLRARAAGRRGAAGAAVALAPVLPGAARDPDAEGAARARERVVGDVSHELRTPLTSIRGFVELLRQGRAGPLAPRQAELLAVVDANAGRLQALVEGLLEAERAETAPLAARPVPLAPLLREVLEAEAAVAARADLELRVDGPAAAAAVGDPEHLRRVFANLASNAVKYTPAGRVAARVGPGAPGRVVVEVEDTGVGIRPEDRPRLFERFFRGADPAVRRAGGSGLGLTIVRTLVERMAGTIDVEGAPGRGTRVRVDLPAAVAGAAGEATA